MFGTVCVIYVVGVVVVTVYLWWVVLRTYTYRKIGIKITEVRTLRPYFKLFNNDRDNPCETVVATFPIAMVWPIHLSVWTVIYLYHTLGIYLFKKVFLDKEERVQLTLGIHLKGKVTRE